ncbi:MAG: asparagine synthase (glutamine-hydrolyzing) [Acidobacteria bacterium]|nr:asparagine synthase (glutamine-hydrolyzing) [Acidobacteriota bacterium]
MQADSLHRMRDAMLHRGPDDADIHLDGPVGLGHRRLSIVDLSPAGRQPMSNEDDTVWLVCNGEIYNYVELRAELQGRGHTFRSHSDSEIILHLYEELGTGCLSRLNGMFAFIIWDARRRHLFAARDRLGVKTLHYYRDASQLICSSEVKAILADPSVPRRPDHRTLADYLFCGYPLGGRTAFEGIQELRPGHFLVATDAGLTVEPYWDLQYSYRHDRSDAQLHDEVGPLLDDAVRIHCRSDASLGCHLSGGLDSGVVTGLTARHRTPLDTFSIRFAEGGYYDESAQARAVSGFLGTTHHEIAHDASDFARLMPSLLWHLEVPMMTFGGYSYFTVSRLASRHVKVALTGHGGDEVFAGYAAHFKAAFGTTAPFDRNTPPPASNQAGPESWTRRLQRLRAGGLAGVRRRLGHRLRRGAPSLEDTWVALHCAPPPAENLLLHKGFLRTLAGYDPRAEYLQPLSAAPTHEVLDRCLHHDLRSYLPGLLHMEDRLSMSVSLESRVPLLDYRLVELMATVPPAQKVRDMQPKAVLRAAAETLLAPEVHARAEKRPFPVPMLRWLSTDLAPLVRDVLTAPRTLDRGIFTPDRLRAQDLEPAEQWAAMNVEMWFRVFIDQDQSTGAPVSTIATEASRGRQDMTPIPTVI